MDQIRPIAVVQGCPFWKYWPGGTRPRIRESIKVSKRFICSTGILWFSFAWKSNGNPWVLCNAHLRVRFELWTQGRIPLMSISSTYCGVHFMTSLVELKVNCRPSNFIQFQRNRPFTDHLDLVSSLLTIHASIK